MTYTMNQLKTAAEIASKTTLPLDSMPYTPEFEDAYIAFVTQTGAHFDRNAFWRCCLSVRKRGMMKAKRRSRFAVKNSNIPSIR